MSLVAIAPPSLPVADHGDLIAALPFFLPALLIVGALLVVRAFERKRHDAGDRS